MKNRSFKVLCRKQIRNARRGSKEEPAMKHSWWQSFQPLLEYFLEFNLCMLYVVSKLRKSKIQCFKRCAIRSWNEGVTAIVSRSLQAEGRFLHGCENLVLLLRKFRSHFAQCTGVLLKLPDICDRHFEIFCFRYLMSKSPNSPCNPLIRNAPHLFHTYIFFFGNTKLKGILF